MSAPLTTDSSDSIPPPLSGTSAGSQVPRPPTGLSATSPPGLVLPFPYDSRVSSHGSKFISNSTVTQVTSAAGAPAPTPNVSLPSTNCTSRKRKKAPAIANNSSAPDTTNLAARQKEVEDRIQTLQAMLDAAESSPPTMVPNQSDSEAKPKALYSSARDVWGLMRGWHSRDIIPPEHVDRIVKDDAEWQDSLDYSTLRHPTGDCIRCVPCLALFGTTKTWVNSAGGMTRTLRDHLVDVHPAIYYSKCHEKGLNERLIGLDTDVTNIPPEFTNAGLVEQLVEWIVSDDQALNVVEKKELRELLIYCGQGRIQDNDIPHRDKLAAAAWAMYLIEKEKIDDEMKNARGTISITSDLWSDMNFRSFMSVTAHYINEHGTLVDRLIAFRKIDGHHTGANVGHVLFEVLQESGIVNKIGYITLDNAAPNNTLMEELTDSLRMYGAEFDPEKNRIRCFPHVINLAVQTIIKELAHTAAEFRSDGPGLPISEDGERYLQALESNPVELCRASVSACRASGLRRDGLRKVIEEGNRAGRFRLPGGTVYTVPALQLLRDMPVRWSSTYNMLKRYLELYPAIVEYAFRVHRETQIPILSHKQYEVLQDIVAVLSIAHHAQELLSAEKTPTLSLAFPVYETIIEAWEQYAVAIPELGYAITCGIRKISEYINRTRDAPVHALAMFVNPSLKLEWVHSSQTGFRGDVAELAVKQEMLRIHRASGGLSRRPRPNAGASDAARAQHFGYMRLLTRTSGATVRRASDIMRIQAQETTGTTLGGPSSDDSSAEVAIGHAPTPSAPLNPFADIEEEFIRYMAAGINATNESDTMGIVDLVDYWKVHQYTYPLLYQIAMNVLPAQASAVSSERVFSSSKKTCTSERSRLSADSMEYLQVLKHSLVRRRRTRESSVRRDDEVFDFVTHLFENLEISADDE